MPKRIITKRLGDVLLERGIINRKQLEHVLAYQQEHGGLLGQILIHLKCCNEEDIALALTAQYGFPYLPLENYELDASLMALIPESIARQYCLIPIDRIGNALTLAMADPSNVNAIEEVERLTQCIIQAFISTPSDILSAIEKFYPRASEGAPSGPTSSKPSSTGSA